MSHRDGIEGETIFCNGHVGGAFPVLTIASPYFQDDPTVWIQRLMSHPRAHQIEIIVVDDGTGDNALDDKVQAAIRAWPGPATRVRFARNQGRSQARNRAIEAAQGAYVLFIDADMVPFDDFYLDRYLAICDAGQTDIVFGGFALHPSDQTRATALHYCLAQSNDCGQAVDRAARGPLSIASNNLLVRREVLAAAAFDGGFAGWGWEDTEWAIRAVSLGYSLLHVDNPAMHLGLVSTEKLLQKYKESGANLLRLLDRHPAGHALWSAKISILMAKVPYQDNLRPLYHWACVNRHGILPMWLRMLSAKLWRASFAAEALASRHKGLTRKALFFAN